MWCDMCVLLCLCLCYVTNGLILHRGVAASMLPRRAMNRTKRKIQMTLKNGYSLRSRSYAMQWSDSSGSKPCIRSRMKSVWSSHSRDDMECWDGERWRERRERAEIDKNANDSCALVSVWVCLGRPHRAPRLGIGWMDGWIDDGEQKQWR